MKPLPLLLFVLSCVALAAPAGCATSESARDSADAPRPTSGPARDLGATPLAVERDPDDPLAAPADVAAPPPDAVWTASGLASKVLAVGTGTARPRARDTVVVHYTGWQIDGTRFDSSVERGEPAVFPLNRVIPGWTEGLQLMVVGEKRRLWIPAELAYGNSPREGAPAGPLVFDVELLGIE